MSSQPPVDPSCQPVPSVSCGHPDLARAAEYISLEREPYPEQPMRRPAYLYPLPYTPMPTSVKPVAPPSWSAQPLALMGFLLGLASALLWVIPYLGGTVSLSGIAFSVLGWRTPRRKWLAIAGCALSIATLVLGTSLNGYILPN